MKPISFDKNLKVTYAELDEVLSSMGFSKSEYKSNDEFKQKWLGRPRYFYRYVNEGHDYTFHILKKNSGELAASHALASLAQELALYGITKKQDDLAVIIESHRQAARKNAA